ncbi:hypothetical protein MPH_13887 [Macrophomina phaseolina MS6]|uniref:Uncharacterized protein n=1 Tax=Macrophomina phaseolina (strain MS6) TaxID=1126212 RepID=K2R894_MACPH|nr:hypothetical protein MPH_13887 [Macrophomina phaseolina MS6]
MFWWTSKAAQTGRVAFEGGQALGHGRHGLTVDVCGSRARLCHTLGQHDEVTFHLRRKCSALASTYHPSSSIAKWLVVDAPKHGMGVKDYIAHREVRSHRPVDLDLAEKDWMLRTAGLVIDPQIHQALATMSDEVVFWVQLSQSGSFRSSAHEQDKGWELSICIWQAAHNPLQAVAGCDGPAMVCLVQLQPFKVIARDHDAMTQSGAR